MALTASSVEQITQWCLQSETLADIRAGAKRDFFGEEDAEPINYIQGADEMTGRERRFLGWFAFYLRLTDGRHPAELAAEALLAGEELAETLKSIREARYILGMVTMVIPGKTVFLGLEKEEFEITSPLLSRNVIKEEVVCVTILPAVRKRWVLGPGWFTWPLRYRPEIRFKMKNFQPTPVEVERLLQRRSLGKESQPAKSKTQ